LSSEDNFKGDLLAVSALGPPDIIDPEVDVTNPTSATSTSEFALTYTATDNIGVSACGYLLDTISTPLPTCADTSMSAVSLGTHELQVFATDGAGNTGMSPLVTFTVTTDTSFPVWTPLPVDQTLQEGDLLNYQVTAIDNDAIASYAVNDTVNFTMNPATGVLGNTAPLSEGDYPLTVSAKDPAGNTITADITVTVLPLPPPAAFFDDFDSGDLSAYGQIGGNWSTVSESGRGLVLRQTTNEHTLLYAVAENFSGSYQVTAEIWNEDNDAAGVAFRVNTADADNFYSCSATADTGFQAGLWQHVNDLNGPPTTLLAGASWNYVRSRWYTVTITVDQTANTLHCQWESAEAGVELDVTAVDPDPGATGSIGIRLSSEDNFKGDLLEVSALGPP